MTETDVSQQADELPLTDLSEALRSSDGANVRAKLAQRLSGLEAGIAEALKRGVDAEEYNRLVSLDAAVKSAGTVLANFA